jgi:hypothetical protein
MRLCAAENLASDSGLGDQGAVQSAREERPSFAARVGATLAWVLPVAVALGRTSAWAQWRGDVAAVRDLALGGVGWGGGSSTALAQLAQLIPVGSRTFRASLVSVVALGVLARALYALVLGHLRGIERDEGRAPSTWGAPWLAAIAAMVATMTPTLQAEGTVGGSAIVAAAMALVLMRGAQRTLQDGLEGGSGGRRLGAGAVVLGLLAGERGEVALLVVLALLVGLVTLRFAGGRDVRVLVPRRFGAAALCLGAGSAMASLLPALLRHATPLRSWLASGDGVPSLGLRLGVPIEALVPSSPHLGTSLLEVASSELGAAGLVGSIVGTLALASKRRTRPITAAIIALVLADAVASGWLGSLGLLGGEAATASRLVSLSLLASTSTAGLFVLLGALIARRVPLARPAAAMVLAFHATSVALVVEQADARADRSALRGADTFTRMALDELPAGAAIWSDEPATTWRLLSAQLLEGRRPDVLVVPRRLVVAGELLPELVEAERAVVPLLRSLALSGSADELALCELADRRPVFVEPERAWSVGMYEHLGVSHAWSRYFPEPRGIVERTADIARAERSLGPLLRATAAEDADGRTASAIGAMLRSQSKALLRVGEPEAAHRWLSRSDAPLAVPLARSGSLDVAFAGAIARLESARDRAELRPDAVASRGTPPARAR